MNKTLGAQRRLRKEDVDLDFGERLDGL